MSNEVPVEVPRVKPEGPQGLCPWTFPRDCINHDTPKVFPHIFILASSQTRKEGFLSLESKHTFPRKYHIQYFVICCPNISRAKSQYTSLGCRKNAKGRHTKKGVSFVHCPFDGVGGVQPQSKSFELIVFPYFDPFFDITLG